MVAVLVAVAAAGNILRFCFWRIDILKIPRLLHLSMEKLFSLGKPKHKHQLAGERFSTRHAQPLADASEFIKCCLFVVFAIKT